MGKFGEEKLAEHLLSKNAQIISDLSEKYFEILKKYFYIGGMPEAVKIFIETNDYDLVRQKQTNILLQYTNDFSKHIDGNELPRTYKLFDHIPSKLLKDNKKFVFANIKKGAKLSEYELAIEWLKKSGIIYVIYRLNDVKIPFNAYKSDNAFKIYMVDIGLLCAMCEISKETLINGNELFIEFKGALAEQFVAQQLISICNYTPYYFMSEDNNYEVDFVISNEDKIIPIEIKSGKKCHKNVGKSGEYLLKFV